MEEVELVEEEKEDKILDVEWLVETTKIGHEVNNKISPIYNQFEVDLQEAGGAFKLEATSHI